MKNTTVNAELCPRCHASIALTSYRLPFEEDIARAYCNPSSADTPSIKSSLSNASAELATLAEEIPRVELLLSALKTHHTHLKSYIHRTTRFIQSSPIRQLPTEVLGIIFASACNSFQKAEYKTPLSISLVCSKWRDISMATPPLWTNIYVAPYSRTAGVPVYQHYLQRCGWLPISIKVEVPARIHPNPHADDDDFPLEQTYEYHLDVMGDIYESYAHWKHAEICMMAADTEVLEQFYELWVEHGETPILNSLTLAMKDANTTNFPSIFSVAPSLTAVNLLDRCGSHPFSWEDSPLPWEQLRQVQYSQYSQENPAHLTNLENIFEDPKRRTLVINGPSKRSVTDIFISLNLSFLLDITTLILNLEFWSDDVYQFFRDIPLTESLENLALIYRHPIPISDNTHNPLLMLPHFLQASECEISTFSLVMHGREGTYTAQPTLADTLVDALSHMDHLKNLQVIEAPSGAPLLNKRLFEQLSTDAFLPKLTSLELVWAEDRQPDSELLSALSSRADGPLSTVVLGIRSGGNLEPDVLECMRELRQRNVRATCW